MTRLLRASIVAVAASLMWGCTSEILVPVEDAVETANAYGDPTVTLSASPLTVASGGSAALTWSSTNATRCTASGGWSGSKSMSGSQSTGVLTATTSFSLSCARWRYIRGWVTASRTVTVSVPSVLPPPSPGLFPVRVEAGKRYLIDAFGRPFLVHGDAAWSLMVQLTMAEVDQYLEDRRLKGFNTILVNLLEHQYSASPPRNVYGNGPFLTPGDFGTPNEAYFAHVEYVIAKAAEKGMLLLLTPAYMGSGGGSGGWYAEMTANGATKLRTYGQYLATRFRNYGNILWVHGGDFNPPERTLLRAVANGILDIDTKWLHTFHGPAGTAALGLMGTSEPWLTVNDIYANAVTVVSMAGVEYNRSTMPFFLIEGDYETAGGGGFVVRQQAYQAVLAGAAGQVMGNSPVWMFGTGWSAALNSPGARTVAHLRTLFEARNWWTLAPDISHTLLVAGLGSGSTTAGAALASDRAFALVYVPSVRNVTIDLAQLAGPGVTARWYDPTTGTFTAIAGSPFAAANGASVFRPASLNSAGEGDWVLVLESSTGPTPSAPTVTLTANPSSVPSGSASALTWGSTDATACTASGGWSGTKAVSGSQSTGALTATTSFALTCTGPGGSANQTASVTVTANPVPTVTLTANPTSVVTGGSSTLTWNSINATSCTASGGWTGAKGTSGNQSTGALTATTSYTLTCTGTGGSAAQSTTVTVTSLPPPPPPPTGPYVYPLKLAPAGRYLVDQNDVPFLMVGDAAWSLVVQVSLADANTYLANRGQLGFNTILVSLIEHAFATNAPANLAGARPFTGRPFATPNEAYFAHADAVLQAAAQQGITVLLAPAYLGVDCQGEGWCVEVQQATNAEMRAWGEFLGNRYRNYDNIIWVVGGDADPAPVAGKLTEMVAGIQAFDTRHLLTAHNDPERMAIDRWSGPPAWLTVNNTYTYSATPYVLARTAYRRAPTMPFFFMEDTYENSNGVTQAQLRAQSYWTLLSGAFGHVFGNCPIWHFDTPNVRYCTTLGWQSQLNNQGSQNMRHFQKLFRARRWSTLVPDDNHVAITAGYGTFGQTNYVTAAYATDGSSIIAYLPSSRTITVSGSRLSGAAMTVYWYHPGTGVSTALGTYSTAGTNTFTPPFAGDWVLVADSQVFGFPAP